MDKSAFREVIVAEMKARNWNPYQLVKESGVDKNSVYGFLSGERTIQSDGLEQICTTLGLELKRRKE